MGPAVEHAPPPPASQAGAGAQSLGQTWAPENASGGTHALNTFSLSFAWQQVDGPLRRMKAVPPAPVYGEPRFAEASRILSLLPSPPSQIRTLRRKGKKNKNLIGLLLLPKHVSFQALQFFCKSPPYPSESAYFLQKRKRKEKKNLKSPHKSERRSGIKRCEERSVSWHPGWVQEKH